eukprot:Phypoly_transcript_02027.p1 GENE.Phypoly_transcript_02027~~Phypoly_transcript_02027.p1  ORF type:complete len:816 (+),score=61.48 Phypoly_transcript_02027:208-2655(+)
MYLSTQHPPPLVHQELLVQHIKDLFNVDQTQINTKKQSNIKHPIKGTFLELDIWIPNHNICFEFQDTYHYISTWYKQMSLMDIEMQDQIKKEAIQQAGLTLVTVPCWWCGDSASLVASIYLQRPDLQNIICATESAMSLQYRKRLVDVFEVVPIPLNPLNSLINSGGVIPSVEPLMLASFPHTYDNSNPFHVETNTWWIGEKYDGVRVCWVPFQMSSYSRNGNKIDLLAVVSECLPTGGFVDGEYWFGRGSFSQTGTLVKNTKFAAWHLLRMLAFDDPSRLMRHAPFESRYQHLLDTTMASHPVLIVAPRILCQGTEHLARFLQGIIEEKGEGVILRFAGSLYTPGRSNVLLKFKTYYGDREGIVVRTSASNDVTIKLDNGRELTVTSYNVHIPTPAIGDIVSFSHDSFSRGDLPLNPVIYRVRSDLLWENDNTSVSSMADDYWTPRNMRLFMENFTKNKAMGPLRPDTSSLISEKEIRQSKGAEIYQYSSYFTALQHIFPDTKLTSEFLHRTPWQHIENRRKVFESYAASNSFDPLLAENWYAQPIEHIMAIKGMKWLISYHGNKVATALEDLFPDIGLDKSLFAESFYGPKNRRLFFENYAKDHNFDPLLAENWYSQAKSQIMATKGAHTILAYHNASISKALADLFPHIGIDRNKFLARSLWHSTAKRRQFFEEYAKANSFDSNNALQWYQQSVADIMSIKGAKGVIAHHRYSVSVALMELFPDIGLDRDKLWCRPTWQDSFAQRALFEKYATIHGFNPLSPEPWYHISKDDILSFKGMKNVIAYHSHSISKTLLVLFPEIGLQKERFWLKR